MVQVSILRRRSWVSMTWLLVFIIGLLVALTLGNTLVLLSAIAMAALVVLLMLRGQAPALASSPAVSMDTARSPRAQCTVSASDGTMRQALVVPAAAVDGYQTVLTIDGYALVNAEGRVVYGLNRQPADYVSEPVVVTILDIDLDPEVAAR